MRKTLLSYVKRVVIKVGSGVISGNDGLDATMIEAIAHSVNELRQRPTRTASPEL